MTQIRQFWSSGYVCKLCASGGHRVVYFSEGSFMRYHATKEHVRCSCGWIGISFGAHRAQITRRGAFAVNHRLEESLGVPGESALEKFDA